MSDPPRWTKRELLAQSLRRVREAGAAATEFAVERVADRFTPRVCRPPGALPEIEFLMACTRCGECVKACPAAAILTLNNEAGLAAGTPFLDANRYRPCVSCADAPCMPACPTGALRVVPIQEATIGTARLNREVCVAWTGESDCARCLKACPWPDDALVVDDEGRPWIDARSCNGCGLCVHACPTGPRAIRIDPPPRF
jgi:MauM/NapG family ferredoxin protein